MIRIMKKNLMINYLIVPITLAVTAIVTVILAICKQGWVYYLIGSMTALLNHGLMVKQSFQLERYAKLDPEGTTLKPKRTVAIWYLLRVLVFVGVFVAIAFKAELGKDPQGIWYFITAFGGYMTLKVILISLLLISGIFSKRKVDE